MSAPTLRPAALFISALLGATLPQAQAQTLDQGFEPCEVPSTAPLDLTYRPTFGPVLRYLKPADERKVSLVDSFFIFEFKDSQISDGDITISASRWENPDLDKLRSLYDRILPGLEELQESPPPSSPSREFLDSLRALRTKLTLQERLFFLSLLGDAREGIPPRVPATYLGYAAYELGFNDVFPNKDGYVTFRDPLTQRVFVQKDSAIFRGPRRENSPQGLIERVARANARLVDNGTFHPRTLSWAMEQNLLKRQPQPILAEFDQTLKNHETIEKICLQPSQSCTLNWRAKDELSTATAQAVLTLDTNSATVARLSSAPSSSDSATASKSSAPVAPVAPKKEPIPRPLPPWEAQAQLNLVSRWWENELPEIPSSGSSLRGVTFGADGIQMEYKTDLQAQVRAKSGIITGNLQHEVGSKFELGSMIPAGSLIPGAKDKVEVDVNHHIIGKDSQGTTTGKISLFIDAREPDQKQYLEADGNLYVLRNADTAETVTGTIARIKSTVPTEKLGDFHVVLRMGSQMGATSASVTNSVAAGAGWSYLLGKATALTTEIQTDNGASIQDNSTFSVSRGAPYQVKGSLVLKSSF